MKMEISRRSFLIRSGWTAGGITVLSSCGFMPTLPSFSKPTQEDAFTWLQLTPQGKVRFYLPRSEMGQGISTGLTLVVAEELGLSPGEIECLYPRTDQIPAPLMTVGSQSMELFFEPTARAAATLRETLAVRAAEFLNVSIDDVLLESGYFSGRSGQIVSFANLIDGDENSFISPEPTLILGELRSMRGEHCDRVGADAEQLNIEQIITGAERYSRDIFPDNLAFGSVAKPPQLGSILESYDARSAKKIEGVLSVVEGPKGQIGVVAETPMASRQGVEALVCIWRTLNDDEVALAQRVLDVDQAIDNSDFEHTAQQKGSLTMGAQQAEQRLSLRYDLPMTAHVAMEPRSGVARVIRDQCEVWTGSQDPWLMQKAVANLLGFNQDNVIVHNQRIGGAFGGRILCQATVEAAWLAQAVERPVRVQWSREEELRCNYVGPQFSHRIDAGVTKDGKLSYWQHRMLSMPILTSSIVVPESLHWAADLIADSGTQRGTQLPYKVAHCSLEFSDVRLPMPSGAWRGLGAAPNTFAVECTMDQLAFLAVADPFDFRLAHLLDDRLANVLQSLRILSDWDNRQSDDSGFGMACAHYKETTQVAVVAEVIIKGNQPKVIRLWCVQDCGLVVNPDQVHAQIEGSLVWGIGMALFESYQLENATCATTNFDTYRIPRQLDVPDIEVALVDSIAPPRGSGEAAFAPAAAAIANAVFDLTGQRSSQLPIDLAID